MITFRKYTAVLMAAMLLLSGCAVPAAEPVEDAAEPEAPAAAEQPENMFSLYDIPAEYEDPFAPERKEVYFSDLEGMRYEGVEQFRASAARMEAACGEQNAMEELKELYKFLYGEMVMAASANVIASIEFDKDSRNEQLSSESIEAGIAWSEMNILYENAVKKALESSYGEEFAAFIGEDVAETFMDELSDPKRATELVEREGKLLEEYYRALQQEYTVEHNGIEWSEYDLYENMDQLSEQEYYDLLNHLLEEKNAACAPIYLELVKINRETAQLYGYDNVAEYCYEEIYNRDYSPGEAKAFHESVKKYIVPAYQALREMKVPSSGDAVVETGDIIPIMESIMPRISQEMAGILDYMTSHGMIYLADDFSVSMDKGYSTPINHVAQPFIYNSVYGDAGGLSDTIHEFGHYCDYHLNGFYGASRPGKNYDMAEVCSMGLEMLAYQYYDDVLEGDTSDEKLAKLKTSLINIIDACMYDEAQQRIFEYQGELTVDTVNEIFRQVAREYGLGSNIDGGYTWVEIMHTFEKPFYYISYGAACSAAMEIWLVAQEQGQDAAIEIYLQLLSRGSFEYGYAESLEQCGMRGFRQEEFIAELAEAVLDEAEELQEALPAAA